MNYSKWNHLSPSKSPLTNFLDDFFNSSLSDIIGAEFTTSKPSINIVEEDDKFILSLAAPGLSKEVFDIKLDKDQLIISAEIKSENDEVNENFKRREFNYNSFKRSFFIPKSVNRDSIEASYEDGILSLKLSKTEEAKVKEPTKINIS